MQESLEIVELPQKKNTHLEVEQDVNDKPNQTETDLEADRGLSEAIRAIESQIEKSWTNECPIKIDSLKDQETFVYNNLIRGRSVKDILAVFFGQRVKSRLTKSTKRELWWIDVYPFGPYQSDSQSLRWLESFKSTLKMFNLLGLYENGVLLPRAPGDDNYHEMINRMHAIFDEKFKTCYYDTDIDLQSKIRRIMCKPDIEFIPAAYNVRVDLRESDNCVTYYQRCVEELEKVSPGIYQHQIFSIYSANIQSLTPKNNPFLQDALNDHYKFVNPMMPLLVTHDELFQIFSSAFFKQFINALVKLRFHSVS